VWGCYSKTKLEKVALDGSVECCAPPPRWCDLVLWPFDPKTLSGCLCPKMHQWQKFGENLSIDTGDIVETWKSGMHSVMPWPWTLTFWPQNLISSSLSRGAPVTKVWRKSVNRYWRYHGNIKLPRESRTDARTVARTDDPKPYSLRRRLPASEA